jgi:hypothetical protein
VIVWLASYPRSGNTLLRTVLNQCFGLSSFTIDPVPAGLPVDFKHRDLVGDASYEGEWSEFYKQSTRSPETVFIKTHLPPEDDADAICVVRDGRMALLSYLRFHQTFHPEAGRTLLELALGLDYYGSWAEHYRTWGQRSGTLLVRYEDLVVGKAETLSAISVHLKKSQIGPWENPFDKLTEIAPTFFRAGKVEWQRPPEWSKFIDQVFYLCQGQIMAELGYPVSTSTGPSYVDELKQLLSLVARTEFEKKALQKVCRQRQAVIDELKQACDDRLSLINQLSASSRKVNARPFPDSFRAADADQNDAQRPVASNEVVAD